MLIVLLVPFALMLHLGVTRRGAAQDTKQLRLIRESFIVVPACHGCYPVEVMGIALSGYPLEVLLAQATVENRSDKTVTAVKLAWKVHGFTKGIVPHDLLCGVPSEGKVFLSGNTPLISLGQLAPTETCHIGQKPLVGKAPATHTVFIDYPILSADDIKSLPVDETRRADKYAIALYVSEIHYADGTTWAFEKQPGPG
jgi:hypothetical protein